MPDPLPAPPNLQVAAIGLFLDVDGTLVEIEREPGAVQVPTRLCTLLGQLGAATDDALALVSGRSVAQLDQLFAPLRMNAAGLHGLERRNLRNGVVRAEPDPAVFAPARAAFGRFARDHEGVLLEDKGLTLALHYRNAPQWADQARRLARAAAAASNGALVLLEGKMVLELKPPDVDKGQAIAAFMEDLLAPHPQEVYITGPAGSVGFFNGQIWHGSTTNRSKQTRRVYHCALTARENPQQTNQREYLRPETEQRLSPAARYILDV